ncbi:response regulator [Allonocardiopsis opalescens]|uniref:LuxR family two component transcriptional regulator n=1 Tax=Allonocardiopsis opalescens TaxID=1144618 RepID=A0A2T0PS54_9ACTN|nr:response regulator transcription factor [Allonocardiopsis opalescens]PRX91733.1 LuxR family two component transcriptional regulator [Allonocardiopsis opalescens]
MSAPVRVLIVDDQVLMRQGLRKLLEIEDSVEVVGEAANGVEALAAVPRTRPHVALVDARMPRMDGIELVRRLGEAHPEVAALILTTFDEDEYIFGGLRAGARGYLLKDTPPEELVSAIAKAARGETVLGGPAAARVVAALRRAPAEPAPGPAAEAGGGAELSEREREVARLVGTGAANAEIARRLFITEGTVKNHISSILRKLGLRDRTRLALYAASRLGPP